ncbi:hypothetical protein Nepgr_008104 [Nepenthes gracilis]|uniref:Uncharacterized protein n=1 Tax=Nepenthes gracilis TaxID=150966 RepID=A0AAD3S8G4_NEPGR|nr:hypothetical protein Nepgr_008104 [Nepenthes gracilis]
MGIWRDPKQMPRVMLQQGNQRREVAGLASSASNDPAVCYRHARTSTSLHKEQLHTAETVADEGIKTPHRMWHIQR